MPQTPQIMDKDHPTGNPTEPVPETAAEPSFSTFNRALEEYLENLPKDKDKDKFKFIELCRNSGTDATPQAINALLQQKEARSAISGPVHRIFSRVMSALKDYSEVIGQLVSAQPLPCAIIWGALKVVVEASNRCDSMFESIQKELLSLAEYLQRITVYEDLYGDSKEMQRLFFSSYTNIIHFWHRVHKECKRKAIPKVARGLTSSPLNDMDAIISEIHSVSNSIIEQASLCQGQKDKQEYSEARAERKLQNEWREKQSVTNYFELCTMIRDHLRPSDDVALPNSRRHEANLRSLQPETCHWLKEESCYNTWCGPKSEEARLFCISGFPGYGKSMLTSFVIHELESKGAAVAYYFCQFSQPCDDPTQILRLLALQLFNIYFERKLPLSEDFSHDILQSRRPEDIRNLIDELVRRLLSEGGVYFFIDGLDEASTNGISPVLEFLVDLQENRSTSEAGLWVTKRQQARTVDCFETHIQPHLKLTLELARHHTEADVVRFLRAKLQALKQRFCSQESCGLSEAESALFEAADSYLISRAQGNFLWARLMTRDFDGENRVEDVKELLERILGDTPEELAHLYHSYFDRFNRLDRDDKRIAIKVMSLVAFARRQLRLEELQAAAASLANHGKKKKTTPDISAMPPKKFLAKYTTLVEVDGDTTDPAPTDTCRLVHSSVLEYLDENPAVLDKDSKDPQLQFSRFTIANACLVYLARPVFSQLLQKQSLSDTAYTWVDSTGASVDKQVFSQYASKYWVRHADDLNQREQDQIRARVVNFVSSNNFQTCMQIQSIWVQGRFDEYYVRGQLSLLRAIPEWLIRERLSDSKCMVITKHWLDYRELMHDWRTLLSCGSCHDRDPDCSYLTFRGESDRIWWTTLGPEHLFSKFQGRYTSFRLVEGGNTCSECFEALSVSKKQIVIVRLRQWNRLDRSLHFICEHWSLSDYVSAPTLSKKQAIWTTEAATNWLLYVKPPSEGLERLVAKPLALSGDAHVLRLGSQLFRKGEDDEYRIAPGGDAPTYFEEVDGRGTLVAIGSRSHALAAQLQEPYRIFEDLGKDFTLFERLESPKDTNPCTTSQTEDSDDDWLSEASSSDASDIELEAHESWSEGSTEDEDYISSSDSSSEPDSSESPTVDSGSEAESEEDSTSNSSIEESEPVRTKSASSEDTPSELSRSAFPSLGEVDDSDHEEELWGMEVDARLGIRSANRFRRRSANTREPTVLLTVIQYNDSPKPTKLFEYSSPSRFMLYDSPPVVHPKESLVVWPLGGGDLLFADVAARTYFTRQLRPSASHTRQISIKLQFSPCGRFLHVATLEVRVQTVEGDRNCKNMHCLIHHPLPGLHLYILVLTYRLSSRKPARSPPVLIHRIKIDLGKYQGLLSVSQLPFVFTWTPRDLFVSRRGTYLEVFRIQLFNDQCTGKSCLSKQTSDVLIPKKKVLLPDSASLRDVYFVPLSEDNNGASMVIVGSETRARAVLMEDLAQPGVLDALENETSDLQKRRTLAPSVGAIFQAEDLGGWIQAEGISVPQSRSMGNLDLRREKFDPVDDCNAEPY